jgi:CHASE3 domain sensor protein
MVAFKKWHDLSLRAKGLWVVAIPVGAMVAIAWLSYTMGGRVTAAEEWANHTRQACEEIQKMETLEAEASAETRAYFITGDHEFTRLVWEIFSRFDSARKRSVVLTAGHPTQLGRLAQLARMARSRSDRLFGPTALFHSNALPANELRAALRAADQERLQMATVIEAMLEEEKRLLDERLSSAALLRSKVQGISAVCIIFGVTGSVVIALLFASGITLRIGRVKENVAKLITGGLLDPLPEGQDEIGTLAQAYRKPLRFFGMLCTASPVLIRPAATCRLTGLTPP